MTSSASLQLGAKEHAERSALRCVRRLALHASPQCVRLIVRRIVALWASFSTQWGISCGVLSSALRGSQGAAGLVVAISGGAVLQVGCHLHVVAASVYHITAALTRKPLESPFGRCRPVQRAKTKLSATAPVRIARPVWAARVDRGCGTQKISTTLLAAA